MRKIKILLIEDDANVRDLIRMQLADSDCLLDEAADGELGMERALSGEHDLLILDINLPKIDGLEICRRVRLHNQLLPILMLTAKRDEIDRVLGLELGADDYLTKPFSIRELTARIRAILRRVKLHQDRSSTETAQSPLDTIHFRDLLIDIHRRKVVLSDKLIALSNMEFELLAFLAAHPGKAFTREDLMEQVWGYTAAEYAQNVSTHINRLRKKLEPDIENPVYVKTVRGFGYAFAELDDFAGTNA